MERISGKFLLIAGFMGILVALLTSCMFDVVKVQGKYMEPSVKEGSKVLVSRNSYFFRQPDAGDVIVFDCDVYSEDEESSSLIRRVAATEGDRVKIKNGTLYVNDKAYEGHSKNNIYLEPMEEITIGKNRVFVLSDTQLAALDSRDQAVGQLRLDEIKGRVCFK